jgi:hypothetical protein
LDASLELEDHARIDFDSNHSLGDLQELHREVTRPGADLQDDVGGFEAGLLDDALHDEGILQDVLPFGLLELDAPDAGMPQRFGLPDLATGHGHGSRSSTGLAEDLGAGSGDGGARSSQKTKKEGTELGFSLSVSYLS